MVEVYSNKHCLMLPDNYPEFSFNDFLKDDYFLQWVISPTEESDSFWQSFKEAHPQKIAAVQKAADTIIEYRKQAIFENSASQQQVWQRIAQSVNGLPVAPQRRIFSLPVFLRVAAVLLIATSLLVWFVKRPSSENTYSFATGFGEVKTIYLPDSSQVTLNGNSTLSYKTNKNGTGPREVWINGEGYFNVRHINRDTLHVMPAETFVVHCGDINIEVLGTTFFVKARRGKTNVALLTGKIKIGYTENIAGSKPMILAPGDYVEYNAQKLITNKKLVKPARVTNWTSNVISFTDAPLTEIIETLKDNYGYTISVKDTALLSLKIEGDISVNNVTDLMDVIATTLNVKVEQLAGKHISISK